MPFKKIDVKSIIAKQIQQDPEFKSEYAKVEAEYQLIEQVKLVRQARGMTQKELANKIGVSQQAISRLEKEKHIPKLDNFFKILDGLDLTLCIKEKDENSFLMGKQ